MCENSARACGCPRHWIAQLKLVRQHGTESGCVDKVTCLKDFPVGKEDLHSLVVDLDILDNNAFSLGRSIGDRRFEHVGIGILTKKMALGKLWNHGWDQQMRLACVVSNASSMIGKADGSLLAMVRRDT